MEEIHIGHYILGKTIGNGGFAKVKQARHDLTGIKVAIKILNKRKMKNKNMISKVKREIKILRFLNHPNIIKLYQVLDTTNDLFVIMQLASEGELFDYLQNNFLSEDQARFIFRQIINGIGYAHENLISHRDLKPQNILIDSNKVIKIIDFGLSNLMKDGKLLKTACGSPKYAAPQIIGQRKYQGTSVDIWSCGVILYALLIGRLPFSQETLSLLYKKIQLGIYTIPNSISALAADLISKMLQTDPLQRIKIHEIKNHPWIFPYVPIYSKIFFGFSLEKIQKIQIDKEIFEKIKQFTYTKPLTKTDAKIKKSIKKKADDSFVVAYQLLKNEKNDKSKAQIYVESIKNMDQSSQILTQIENQIVAKQKGFSDYQFGKKFNKSAKQLIWMTLQALKFLGIQFSAKSQQYYLKCFMYTNIQDKLQIRKEVKKQPSSQKGNEIDDQTEKIEKYSKKQIKFNLQIYSLDSNGCQHLIDLHLTQGHPFIFFRISSKIFKMIEIQMIN